MLLVKSWLGLADDLLRTNIMLLAETVSDALYVKSPNGGEDPKTQKTPEKTSCEPPLPLSICRPQSCLMACQILPEDYQKQ
jgi:hypothetical protein